MIRRYAVELFVAVTLLVIMGTTLSAGYSRYARGHNPAAIREAREWAVANKVELEAVTCAREDINIDGYVMCVVMTKDRTLISLDCPLGLWGKTGCKVRE
jgi:hypothetical protein